MYGGYFFGQPYFGNNSFNPFPIEVKDVDKYVPAPIDAEIVQFVEV